MSKVVEADAKPDEDTGKLKEDTVLELLLLVWNCVTELVIRAGGIKAEFFRTTRTTFFFSFIARQFFKIRFFYRRSSHDSSVRTTMPFARHFNSHKNSLRTTFGKAHCARRQENQKKI